MVKHQRRLIGYLNLEDQNIEPHEYNPFKQPVLFTSLEPTKSLYDESGKSINQLEVAVDELYNVLTQQKTDRKKIKPQVQAPGSFKLDRQIYKAIMH